MPRHSAKCWRLSAEVTLGSLPTEQEILLFGSDLAYSSAWVQRMAQGTCRTVKNLFTCCSCESCPTVSPWILLNNLETYVVNL